MNILDLWMKPYICLLNRHANAVLFIFILIDDCKWAKISLVMDTFENVLLFSDLIKKGTSTNCLCQVGSILRLHKNPKTLLHCIFSSWVINRFDALVMDILQNLKNGPLSIDNSDFQTAIRYSSLNISLSKFRLKMAQTV